MKQNHIAFRKTGYFSSLICDYLDGKPELQKFYNRYPSLEKFKDQIQQKQKSFSVEHRKVLISALKNQYKTIKTSETTNRSIELLGSENTFTITTGHQLNLFTGPLYFLYKIIATINLSNTLKQHYPEYNFVPVYWMATEDHDFEEINYFNFKGKKFQWNKEARGAVGELSTSGLNEVLECFSQDLGISQHSGSLKALFKSTYLKHDNLTDATRFLANQLFKAYGLVIIDANSSDLKRLFIPYVENELVHQSSYKAVSETNDRLTEVSRVYNIQVNPREINLFYLTKNLRERIILDNGMYKVNNTNISWSLGEIKKELLEYPERFSPNVIMRPLYQEVILPNLCYIGGGGELAYWLQLKSFFDEAEMPFPMLLLRSSALIQSEKQAKKLKKLNISNQDIFLKRESLINKKVRDISNIDIDFSEQEAHLQKQFKDLYKLAKQTDKSFLGAVRAQETKQIKGLKNLEKRLLKAQKRKLSDQVFRMAQIHNELFPNGSLQERNTNFSELYLEYGETFIPLLIKSLEPLKSEFTLITL
jgi:bacillithiol biosynthesis cysteine-adding enzyme BshC